MEGTDDEFRDIEDVVRWFVGDETEPREGYDADELRLLIANMLRLPDPFRNPEDATTATLRQAWNWILDFNLLHQSAVNGWIDRSGKKWGCGWASHDRLVYWLSREVADVEADGWARVTRGTYRSMFRLTREQRKTLKSMGLRPDEQRERTMPIWSPGSSGAGSANLDADAEDYRIAPRR